MKRSVYPRLAWTGMRKNKRLYTPYLLTCMGMVMMFYIVRFLAENPLLKNLRGGVLMQEILGLGTGVVGVFAAIFLFYTNSFLVRRRKKEFGLYNILGMNKRNLARILLLETLYTAVLALIGGLIAGVALSKLAELCLINILREKTSFTLSVDFGSIKVTLALFAVIFALILLKTLVQVRLSSPISLLRGESAGEKPPRANWALALLGALILGAAYYIALTIEDPVATLAWFFVAVIMVIVGTYLLFISGSVAVCRLLQKNGKYYYKTNHFVSVSSMAYRMRRNGAGLASICILCTMVLVMLSSTACLYISIEDSVVKQYPRELNLNVRVAAPDKLDADGTQTIREMVGETLREHGLETRNVVDYRAAETAGVLRDGVVELDRRDVPDFDLGSYANLYQVFIVPIDDYNRMMNADETLGAGEAMIATDRALHSDVVRMTGMEPLKVKKVVPEFAPEGVGVLQSISSLYVFVADFERVMEPLGEVMNEWGMAFTYHWHYGFDISGDEGAQIALYDALREKLSDLSFSADAGIERTLSEARAAERADVYGLYGGLFFLGILLGLVFIFAAVLIMYYKQVSEGYEDQSRFGIMRKVGMTARDIRRSVNSQVLTVFFLPLATAGVHLLLAFPMIQKMLMLFSLTDVGLLISVTVLCYLIFAAFYVLMYRVTSKAYMGIVSGAQEGA